LSGAWRWEFDDGVKFQGVHLYSLLEYYENKEATRSHVEDTFERVQSDVEPATLVKNGVKIIQVI